MDYHSTKSSMKKIEADEIQAARRSCEDRIKKGFFKGLVTSSLAIGGIIASGAVLTVSTIDMHEADGTYVQAGATTTSTDNKETDAVSVEDTALTGDIAVDPAYTQAHQFDFASVDMGTDADETEEEEASEEENISSDKTTLGRYTLIAAVDDAPFSTQRMVDAAYEAEHQSASDVSGGTKKRAYVSSEAVSEAAAEQEAEEEATAKAEGKHIVRTLDVDIASKATQNQNTVNDDAEGEDETADSSKAKNSNSTAEEEDNASADQIVRKSTASTPIILRNFTKYSVSGELKNTLDAATAEKKDQSQKAEARAEAERQAYLASEEGQRELILEAAYSRLGVPYVWGGTDPDYGMDCSGFTQWCYSTIGIETTRTTYSQYSACNEVVSVEDAKPGDILYSGGHVGIYIGDGQYIHEPQSGDVCRIASDIGQFSCALRFL